MFLRRCYKRIGGKRYAYWALVESYRSERGPRQRVVAWLGEMDEAGRLGVKRAGDGKGVQWELFEEGEEPEWVEVDARRVRVENPRSFGGVWLGLKLAERTGLDEFLSSSLPLGREEAPNSLMALALVLLRLVEPSSELSVAEGLYERTALPELLGVPAEKVNDDRLYRVLDKLLPLKAKLERHLAERMGELFGIEYDLLLYDVTSTYFEGLAEGNEKASLGYSRDHRGDCRQVCIALVVTRCGMPLSFEVFGGNRADVTTVEEMVETVEARYGKADRIWVMDRGMVSRENLEFMREGGRRYIVGTPKSELKRYERELLSEDWEAVREGLEVKLCPSPDGAETFILCRSKDRAQKERAILSRFEARIEKGLESLKSACEKRKMKPSSVERRVGRLLGRNTRAESLFHVDVKEREDGSAELVIRKEETLRAWASLVEGCYLLRSNVMDWSAEELWRAYIQLTQAEAAFRTEKSELGLRPVWHQKAERVEAHILVCFLALVLWKTLSRLCSASGLGDDPRKVLDELKGIPAVDVVLPTRGGPTLRRRCVARPTPHQLILLQRLGLTLPKRPIRTPM